MVLAGTIRAAPSHPDFAGNFDGRIAICNARAMSS
jgi:hypothetical protein